MKPAFDVGNVERRFALNLVILMASPASSATTRICSDTYIHVYITRLCVYINMYVFSHAYIHVCLYISHTYICAYIIRVACFLKHPIGKVRYTWRSWRSLVVLYSQNSPRKVVYANAPHVRTHVNNFTVMSMRGIIARKVGKGLNTSCSLPGLNTYILLVRGRRLCSRRFGRVKPP